MKTGMINVNDKNYSSFFEGFQIEIQIVDHCNLKCDGCNHFSCIADPYFISREEFENNLKSISKLVPQLKRLMIVGGEPLLHPEIENFMGLMREYFPDPAFNIDILTNGIVLNDQLKNGKLVKLAEQLNICFLWTPYPNINYGQIKEYLKNNEPNKKNGIEPLYSRLFFAQPSFNLEGNSDIKDLYENCPYYMIPTLIIRKSKVFLCPRAACNDIINNKYDLNIPIEKGDYLNLDELTLDNLQNFYDNGPSNICKYCNKNYEHFYWHLYQDGLKELYMYNGMNSKDLYLHYYRWYDQFVNGKNIFQYFLSSQAIGDKTYWDLTDPVYGHVFIDPEKNRINGKMDIIIPFFKTTDKEISRLINSLKKQTIINECHIYLISDGADIDTKNMVYDTFKHHFKNVTFLDTEIRQGPGVARQLGIDRSFNQYIFCIDCDDILSENEDILNKCITILDNNNDYDAIHGKVISFDLLTQSLIPFLNEESANSGKYPTDMHGYIFRRKSFISKGLKYKPFLLNEDFDLYYQIISTKMKIFVIQDELYIYLRSTPYSLGQMTNQIEKALYFITASLSSAKSVFFSDFLSKEEKTFYLIDLFLGISEMNGIRQNDFFINNNNQYNEILLIYYYSLMVFIDHFISAINYTQLEQAINEKSLLLSKQLLSYLKQTFIFSIDGNYYNKQALQKLAIKYYNNYTSSIPQWLSKGDNNNE